MPFSERFGEALAYAWRLHSGQERKGSGHPYIGHLLAVCAIVIDHGGGEDEAIAALLHDAVEDQGGRPTLEDIRRRFGDRVAKTVEDCSDTEVTPKPPWRARKEAYLAHLRVADDSSRLVSAADKLHNARCIVRDYQMLGDELWGRFRAGREGTLWYYQGVVEALRGQEPAALVDELAAVVEELVRLA